MASGGSGVPLARGRRKRQPNSSGAGSTAANTETTGATGRRTRGTSARLWADTGPARDWRDVYRRADPGSPNYRGPRDAITGAPIEPDSLILHFADYDRKRKLYLGTAIPYGLHTRQTDGTGAAGLQKDRLGGARWTPQFSRYMSEVRDELTAEQWARLSEWWAVPYVVDRLRALLGDITVNAVLTVTFRRDAYDEAVKRYQVTRQWLARREREVYREARRLLFGPRGPERERVTTPSGPISESEGPMAASEPA